MNAKEYLSQAFCIELLVQSKLEQIEALRSLACRVTLPMGSEPVSHTRNVTGMQDTVERILEAEEELNKRIDDLVATKLEIAKTIDRVEDVTLRLILEKRYLAFLSWGQIAIDLHYSGRWLQVKHAEALEAVERILGEKDAGELSVSAG